MLIQLLGLPRTCCLLTTASCLLFMGSSSVAFNEQVADMDLNIEILNQVLDALDAQIESNMREIEEVRMPNAILAVKKDKFKTNNLFYTTAFVAALGQFLREVAANWSLNTITYQAILNTASKQFAGAAYAGTRLMQLVDPQIRCGVHDLELTKKAFHPLFHLQEYYSFLSRRSLPELPFKYLTKDIIPKVLQVRAAHLGIVLKDNLSCLLESSNDESSNLLRAVDNLVTTIDQRLEVSDTMIRLLTKRAEVSEPLNILWYQ